MDFSRENWPELSTNNRRRRSLPTGPIAGAVSAEYRVLEAQSAVDGTASLPPSPEQHQIELPRRPGFPMLYYPQREQIPLNPTQATMQPAVFGSLNITGVGTQTEGPETDFDPTDLSCFYENDSRQVKIQRGLELFKQFDTVEDSDHHFREEIYPEEPPSTWVQRIHREWESLKDLPDGIYVRAYNSRLDLLRAVIIGTDGTPYHDGLFFFDIHLGLAYPSVPPRVYYHSHGLRINPNLHVNGWVSLSLLNTWHGAPEEKWIPEVSTVLEVLVSIQRMVLNARPYFNEPSVFKEGTPLGDKHSNSYNENAFLLSLKTMLYSVRKQPKHFEDLVIGHFHKKACHILKTCKAYLNGAPVGSELIAAVEGDENRSCSELIKAKLPEYINTLAKAFTEVVAQDCGKYTVSYRASSSHG